MKPHIAVRADADVVARVDAWIAVLSTEWRDATRSDALRFILWIGLDALAADEGLLKALMARDPGRYTDPTPGDGAPRKREPRPHIAVRADEDVVARIGALIAVLSMPWRKATRSDALRVVLLIGLARLDAEPKLLEQLRKRDRDPRR